MTWDQSSAWMTSDQSGTRKGQNAADDELKGGERGEECVKEAGERGGERGGERKRRREKGRDLQGEREKTILTDRKSTRLNSSH